LIKRLKRKIETFNPKNIKTSIKLPLFLNYLDWLFLFLARLIRYIHPILFKIFSIIGNFQDLLDPIYLPESKVIRLNEVLVPLHDGAKLATDVYLPEDIYLKKGNGPTILVRLPYWKDILSIIGYYFASRGYITVLQDIRGSAKSINYGTNSLYIFERSDGKETLRWISKRFWYNGKLGMWGLSYLGITQLAVSWDNDELLTCTAPIHSSLANVFWHPGGLYPIGFSGSLVLIMKSISTISKLKTINFDKWDKEGHYRQLFYNPRVSLFNEPLISKKPKLSDMSSFESPEMLMKTMNRLYNTKVDVTQKDNGALQDLIKQIFYNRNIKHDYELSPYAVGLDYNIRTPMLYIGGWYDMFIEHMLKDVKAIKLKGPEFFKTNFKMIIGPWSHVNLDKLFIKPLKPQHLRDSFTFFQHLLPFWWYEYWLKGKKININKLPPIQAFVLNGNKWRGFKSWPPKSDLLKLFLHSEGQSNSIFGNGRLSKDLPKDEPPDHYVFDPSNPVYTIGGRNLFLLSGPHNQLKIEKRTDVLVYTSKALETDIEIIGEVNVVLFVTSDAVDTDFMVKLVDVFPNEKKAINALDSGIRTRFREGNLNSPKFIEPGKVYELKFPLGSSAILFPKDHKIRIEITSSNFPRFDVNSNLIGDSSKILYKKSEQVIYHSSTFPSHIILPLYGEKVNTNNKNYEFKTQQA
jgi:predicted acyl esterase